MKIINAYCDSLCEPNPGKMEGGIWAKDETDKVLFMENIPMGSGTCNQAEYFALIKLLEKLKKVIGDTKPHPKIIIHSDSQLMTKQLTGVWKVTKGDIKLLYRKAMLFRDTFPFDIRWIPRENNAIADALAQENRLKGSGRQAMMEDGRFRAKRYTPCVELLGDKQMGIILKSKDLISQRETTDGLLQATKVDYKQVIISLEKMQEISKIMGKKLPHINNLADKWVQSTIIMLSDALEEFITMAKSQDTLLPEAYADFFGRLATMDERVSKEEEDERLPGLAQQTNTYTEWENPEVDFENTPE